MKIGILKADSVLPQFQAEFGDYPDMFVARLSANSKIALNFDIYDVEHGDYPASIDACDGYIITGSKKSVYDDEVWIRDLEAYVRLLHGAQKPLVGICFGHQLVAQALGGKTESADEGWGVGVHTSQLVYQKDYMQPALSEIKVLVSHKDQVTVLPPGAELLATSEFCPNAMYQLGEHIVCIQGHPEFIKPYSQSLMNLREKILGDGTFLQGIRSLEEPLDSDTLAKWILEFLSNRSVSDG
ncbi:MAG: GMP synthase-like glutamine amidotransferase [Candidatus Azotimanducaceae bacterium]|jgi:GMP synthase-like glutamine amidotransferase